MVLGGCRHWPAFDRWTNSYLLERMGSSQLTVALTPDGRGDCPVGGRFVLPHEERMDLAAFFETLRDPSGNAVPYIQVLQREVSSVAYSIAPPETMQ